MEKRIKVEFKDHDKVVLTDEAGNTYTSKSYELIGFLHGSESLVLTNDFADRIAKNQPKNTPDSDDIGAVSLDQLLTEERFRKMNVDELDNVIDKKISFEDYYKLEGDWSKDKAELLIQEWKNKK